MKKIIIAQVIFAFLPLLSFSASAAPLSCTLTYNISGWSFLYKEYKGIGLVSCSNGQQANVSIVSRGGGVTFGKSEIRDGKGSFSKIYDVTEVYGHYVSMSGHAGAVNSVEGQAMTKGEVSLVLSGKGRGFDLGFAVSDFVIRPR